MITVSVAKTIIETQYSAKQAARGFDFAKRIGYADAYEFFSIAMAAILYSEDDVTNGARYPVEPGSLDEFSPENN